MARISPIAMRDMLSLTSLGLNAQNFKFGKVTCSSEKFITVNTVNGITIVDTKTRTKNNMNVPVDSAIMNPLSQVLAVRKANAQNPGATDLIIFNTAMRTKMKNSQLPATIDFWKWIDAKTIVMVSPQSVFHWSMDGNEQPVKVFDRHPQQTPVTVVDYRKSGDGKWLSLGAFAQDTNGRLNGTLQVYSVDHKASQKPMDSHASCFVTVQRDGLDYKSNLFCFTVVGQENQFRIMEVGAQKGRGLSHNVPFPIAQGDIPVAMLPDNKYGMVFIITKGGSLFMYEVQSGVMVFKQQASSKWMFASTEFTEGSEESGIMTVDISGRVCHFYVDKKNLVPYVTKTLNKLDLGIKLSSRFGIGGEASAEIFTQQLNQLVQSGRMQEAVQLAANSPGGSLRNMQTINTLKQANPGAVFQYFQLLLANGTLNEVESVELVKPILLKGNKAGMEHIHKWITEGKLSPTEELGDLLKNANITLALSVYLRSNSHANVIGCFLSMAAQAPDDAKALENFQNVLNYSKRVNFTPDWPALVLQLWRHSPGRAKDFAILLMGEEGKLEIVPTINLFMQQNDIKSTTEIILKYLRPRNNSEEDAELQTKVLELNLLHGNLNVVKAIFESPDYQFTHFNKLRIAQMCEQRGGPMLQFALDLYTDMADIKRVLANARLIPVPVIISFFAKIEPEDGMEILRTLMRTSASKNIRLVVEVAKEHSKKFGNAQLIAMFEESQAYNGIYFYLRDLVTASEDAHVIFKFIEAATKLEQFGDVERVCKDSKHYDAEEVKEFLISRNLGDPRPLIYVCNNNGYIDELTQYLYQNNFQKFIIAYVQRMNPNATPEVVGTLCDLNAPEEQIRTLMQGVRPPVDQPDFVERLVAEVEKRNRLKLIRPWIEERVKEGSEDPHLHNGLAKVRIDMNHSPQLFLRENKFYDSLVVGKYCESRDPNLSLIAYRRAGGACDIELVALCNVNGFFKDEAKYLVQQQNPELWKTVLDEDNEFRRPVIDQVVGAALPESRNEHEVSNTVKAFMAAHLPNELIELLERIILHGSSDGEFAQNSHLQNLLILTAIKADKKRVAGYIDRLDHYDGPDIASIALSDQNQLYEEAFFIYKKFKRHEESIAVLLDNIQNITRASEFAEVVDKPEVWSILGAAQLQENLTTEAITSFMQADDPSLFRDVIQHAKQGEHFTELIEFINMARKKVRDTFLDNELLYAYAKTDRLTDLEEIIITGSHNAKLSAVADMCFDEEMYHACKILYKSTNNNAKLAICLVHLGAFEEAVDAARQATSMATWKAVCFACVDAKRFRVAAMCGLNIIIHRDHLSDITTYYEEKGHFDELIALLDQGLHLERVPPALYTTLGVLYSRYREDKLMDHIKFYHKKLNMATLLQECRASKHWKEAVFLYSQYTQFDNAIDTMISQSGDCWDSKIFKEVLQLANTEVAYRAIDFYMLEHPLLLNELCTDIADKLDPSRVVHKVRQANHLPLIRKYLLAVQRLDSATVNKALNDMFLEEDDYKSLRSSCERYSTFDQIELAQITEKHDLLEFRRISAYLYRMNKKYKKSIEVCKRDSLWLDATETAAESGNADLAEALLRFFVANKNAPSFAATLYSCYSLIPADVVMELAWRNGLMDFAMPFLIQSVSNFNTQLTNVTAKLAEAETKEKEEEEKQKKIREAQNTMYQDVMASNGPLLPEPIMDNGMYDNGGINNGINNGMSNGMSNGMNTGMLPPMDMNGGMSMPINNGMMMNNGMLPPMDNGMNYNGGY